MGSDSVRVKILGDEYSLRADCGGDSETVRQVAHYVDSKTKEFWREVPSKEVWRDVPSKANTKVAVMSALNIASELFEVKAKYEAERKQVELLTDKIKSLNERIQKSL